MKSRFLKLISVLCVTVMLLGACAIGVSAFSASDWSSGKKTAIPKYAYSFAVIGDTQMITYNETVSSGNSTYHQKYSGSLDKLYDWIINNQESKNIKFSFHMGDVTHRDQDSEWELSIKNLERMGKEIPYNVIRGNHDGGPRMTEYYTTEMFRNNVMKGEEFGFFDGRGIENYEQNTLNAYQTVTVGDVMYLMLSLDYGPCRAVIEWANEVIAAHPYHNVIISTHAYLNDDKTYNNSALNVNPGGVDSKYDYRLNSHKLAGDAYLYQDASYTLNNLVKKHKNICMVLCGHVYSEYVRCASTTGNNGNKILQFLVNGQYVDETLANSSQDMAGLVAMFYFSADGKKLTTEYYSTLRNQYLHDSQNTVTYDVDVVSVPAAVKDFYKVMHSVSENDYSEADWKDISSAIEKAKQTMLTSDENALKSDTASLASVVNSKSRLDRSALQKAIESAEKQSEKKYSTETWKVFSSALKAANLAQKSRTQSTINKAATELTAAIKGLKAPDYKSINDALEAAKKYEGREAEFDAEKWSAFAEALATAEKYKGSRSQKILDSASQELSAAMEAFEAKNNENADEFPSGAEEEKSGCGSTIAASSVVLTAVLVLGFGLKKKED